jgi:AMP phosphorylase
MVKAKKKNNVKNKNANFCMVKGNRYSQIMKTKLFRIDAGKLICVLNDVDAAELGVMAGDRVEIFNKRTKKCTVALVDTTSIAVQENNIGLFEEVIDKIKAKAKEQLEVTPIPKLKSVDYIRKKMNGEKLNKEEIFEIVKDITEDRLSDIEAIAFTSAVYIIGFDMEETVNMTNALIKNGRQIDFGINKVVDKHSVGGVNGRATMIIVPIVASAGYYMPKTSSRSITSAAGTADAMEVLAPVDLSFDKIKEVTKKCKGVIAWGGAMDLAPADDKIIKLRHPLSIDPEGQVIASVLAKKASAGSKYVIIDLPVGINAKIKSKKLALDLAKKMVYVGKKVGLEVEAIITDGEKPSGLAFGPALEAKYVMEILEGKRFDNLAQKSCELAGSILELVGHCRHGQGEAIATEILRSGKALEKMKEIIKAQGGKITSSVQIILSPINKEVRAEKTGTITEFNIKALQKIARYAGAPANKKAGLLLNKTIGEKIEKGELLLTIFAENERKLEAAINFAKQNNFVKIK